MADEVPSLKRGPARRTVQAAPRPEFFKYLPYLGGAAVVAALIATMTRSPAYGQMAGAALGTALIVALCFAAWQHEFTLQPEDGLRTQVKVVTVITGLVALSVFGLTLYPQGRHGEVTFQRAGEHGAVTVNGAAGAVFLEVSGSFKPDLGPEARARYTLVVSQGHGEETVEGAFERTGGSDSAARPGTETRGSELTSNRHALKTMSGAGRYDIALDHIPDSLQAPVRAAVFSEPYSVKGLALAFALLAILSLGVDVRLSRKGVESAFAASVMVILLAVFILHGRFTHATMTTDMLASGLVGLLGGGLGGEVLARVARAIAPK